ncbi:hypothetical protein MMC17_006000 [Xylographa soralifera]|nr:hypothetical protein [Xylographa soralifera]
MVHALVTGANGFVATHVVDQLITAGYQVTGSVRTSAKGAEILQDNPRYAGKFTPATMTDMYRPGTWDQIFQDGNFDYVFHVAAPAPDNPTNVDFDKNFLEPAVNGNLEILKSASKHGKNIKHITFTSTMMTVTAGAIEDIQGKVLTSATWRNVRSTTPSPETDLISPQITPAEARATNDPNTSYRAAKVAAEKAVWAYVASQSPHYSVSTLLPPFIFGPPILHVASVKHLPFSTTVFYSLFNGTFEKTPLDFYPSYIDVRDLVAMHLACITTPEAANKRFLLGKDFSNQRVVDILKTLPETKARVPSDSGHVPLFFQLDTEETDRVLKVRYHTLERTVLDSARRILELERVAP